MSELLDEVFVTLGEISIKRHKNSGSLLMVNNLLEEEWLTVKAVARKLNVHTTTVYEVIRSGQLRAVRIGRTIRIPRRYLEEFVKELLEATVRGS